MPREQIRDFEKTEAQLEGFYEEIGNISKRKPDDAINKFKLGFLIKCWNSRTVSLARHIGRFPHFVKFDPDAVPTASDVVTMLAQYLRSMDTFRKDHTRSDHLANYFWYVSDSSETIRANSAQNFRNDGSIWNSMTCRKSLASWSTRS